MAKKRDLTVTTINGKPFTHAQSIALARLIFARFGEDWDAATRAWYRLLGNDTTRAEFAKLVDGE